MGDAWVGHARQRLNEASIPSFRTPEVAAGAFGNIASFCQNQLLQQQTWPRLSALAKPNMQRMAGARRGREVHVGLVTDDPFGPVIVFGAGGTMIELIDDRAMELPPLNQFLARRLIERSRVAETLADWRGAPAVNMDALEQVLLRVSEMVCELPQLREMDINPIIVDEHGAVAVDARIVIDGSAPIVGGRGQRYQHLAILPYPARYEQVFPMRGGGEYTVRPIHPDDAQMLQALVQSLSPESRYFRFITALTKLPPSMLARFTLIDYDREMALVAVYKDRQANAEGEISETERIIGVSRYITNPDQSSCEFSLVVADDFSGKGLGTRLMRSLGFTVKPFAEDPDFKLVTHAL